MTSKARSPTLKAVARKIQKYRSQIETKGLRRPGVIGTMIALKIAGGAATREVGLTYLVRKKLPKSALDRASMLPKSHMVDDKRIVTDVLEWPHLVNQALADAEITYDGRTTGKLTCFGRSAAGVFGVTCAHCLTGRDRNHSTPTMVQMYSESAGDYFDTGLSSRSVYARGDGVPGNFGFADCGLFELDDPSLAARGASAQTASTVGEAESLLGKMLQGESALLVDGYPGAQRSAEVIGVHARIDREMFDLVLRVDAPGTYAGDSGMLWKTAQGDAAAIHLRGERTPNGSRTTIAMLASRAENLLDVVLAYG